MVRRGGSLQRLAWREHFVAALVAVKPDQPRPGPTSRTSRAAGLRSFSPRSARAPTRLVMFIMEVVELARRSHKFTLPSRVVKRKVLSRSTQSDSEPDRGPEDAPSRHRPRHPPR